VRVDFTIYSTFTLITSVLFREYVRLELILLLFVLLFMLLILNLVKYCHQVVAAILVVHFVVRQHRDWTISVWYWQWRWTWHDIDQDYIILPSESAGAPDRQGMVLRRSAGWLKNRYLRSWHSVHRCTTGACHWTRFSADSQH